MTEPIRVALVDDQELVRAGLRMLVDSQEDMVVAVEAGDGATALELLRANRTDVVLMDVRMPRMDGVEATRRLTESRVDGAGPQVIVLTTFDLDEYAFAALKAGAAGFLLKDVGPAELLGGIRAVHSGESVVAPSTTRRLIEQFAPHLPSGPGTPDEDRLAALTPREREVLVAVAHGRTNAEIAGELFLAEATVKTHIGRVLAKLGLRDRVHMVLLAYETGLVRPGQTSA